MENEQKAHLTVSAQEKASFVEALRSIVADMPARSQDIIFSRYGVTGQKKMTLEEIGKKYGITRERVRQVIREVFKKMKDKKSDPEFAEAGRRIGFTLEKNSGIMEESSLLELLGGNGGQKGAVGFFLECLGDIVPMEIKGELRPSYASSNFDVARWRAIKNIALDVLKKAGEPLDEKEYFEKISKISAGMPVLAKTLFDYLAVSEEIKINNFGKWGMAKWKEVTPKGTREKAYLVLKEAKKPLHFKMIALQIDTHKLNRKKTHAQTVHNELIKDSKFVLVGRGIYALAEWGFKKGTVKDVLAEILEKSGQPLSKEEILERVLELRHVKKSTVIINLNNFFEKNDKGLYMVKK